MSEIIDKFKGSLKYLGYGNFEVTKSVYLGFVEMNGKEILRLKIGDEFYEYTRTLS